MADKNVLHCKILNLGKSIPRRPPVLSLKNEQKFVGKDVAQVLGYCNTKDAIYRHVDAEDKMQNDGVVIPDPMGREQHPTVISESGLYSLILSSKLPGANNKNGRLKGLFILSPQQNRNDHGTRRKQFGFQDISIYGKEIRKPIAPQWLLSPSYFKIYQAIRGCI